MSDRIKGFTVLLKPDIKEEDAQKIADAIQCLKGVQAVTLSVDSHDDWCNRERVRQDLEKRLWNALRGSD